MSSIAAEKALLREQVRASSLSDCVRKRSDSLLFARFLDLPQVKQARTLLLFWGVRSEPDTTGLFGPLLDAGKRLALPRCLPHRQMEAREYRDRTHLTVNSYGIPEPDENCSVLDPDAFDLILVPNLCCDRRLFRLGPLFIERFNQVFDKYFAGMKALIYSEGKWNIAATGFMSLVNCGIFIWVAYKVFNGELTVGDDGGHDHTPFQILSGALSDPLALELSREGLADKINC